LRRSLTLSLVGIVLVAVLSVGYTTLKHYKPQLGLDLQGGASVVLAPPPGTKVASGVLNQSVEIIRNRVDALGVAEPDISRQGNSIIVQLPGVKNTKRALDIVGQTAELRFRPVLGQPLPPEDPAKVAATTTTTAPATTTVPAPTTTAAPGASTTSTTVKATDPAAIKTTPREEDDPTKEVLLPIKEKGKITGRYPLGPAELTGKALKSAQATVDPNTGQWRVDFTASGKGAKDLLAVTTKNQGRQLAIVLDGVVISAPTIQQPISNQGQITGSFTQKEAKDLALVLKYGALPVQLKPLTVETVSASLGRDSLHAGIVAGLIGLGLVALYMLLYYRALGIVVILGLTVSGALMWAFISYLGHSSGLALSLSGAVGIIVSVGVTVDSYIVYFERLKDEIRSGKTVRSSVDRGFARAYRTILAADLVSLIGATLLYLLTVGAVRGFAFFLGISTVLDMIVAWTFTRPMVVLLGRNRVFTEARWFGVARGLAARPAGGAA
jgi:preprotein translocase subunit SecD